MTYDKEYWISIIQDYGYEYIIGIPCSHIKELFEVNSVPIIIPSREDEAIGIAAGLSLGGKKTLIAIQSSGYSHCINAIETLIVPYRINIDMLISCRNGILEENPVQAIMGDFVVNSINLLGVKIYFESEYDDLRKNFDLFDDNFTNIVLKGV